MLEISTEPHLLILPTKEVMVTHKFVLLLLLNFFLHLIGINVLPLTSFYRKNGKNGTKNGNFLTFSHFHKDQFAKQPLTYANLLL